MDLVKYKRREKILYEPSKFSAVEHDRFALILNAKKNAYTENKFE